MQIKQLSVQEAAEKTQNPENNSNMTYIDVRTQAEFEAGHPAGAINIPAFERDPGSGGMRPVLDQFKKSIDELFGPEDELIIGCQMGGRSQKACEFLKAWGYSNPNNVSGGYQAWVQAGLAIQK